MCVQSSGCLGPNPQFSYIGSPDNRYYRAHATEINYPAEVTETPEEVSYSLPPRTVATETAPEESERREITLSDAIFIAMQESDIIRSGGQFLSRGNGVYTGNINSVYDMAIEESGVLFGGRSVEAALAAFDANFTTSMIWGRDERYNNSAAAPGSSTNLETAAFDAQLTKTFATGGAVSFGHDVDYLGTNVPGTLFPSSYRGGISAAFRQPLLAGAGVEYTRVAGPIGQSFGGISGVSQGVIVARINSDIELANFEASVRNLVKDVEDAYWDLYLAYRAFDNAKTTYEGTQETWEKTNIRWQEGDLSEADEAQARDQLFATEAAVRNTHSAILQAETRLRVLIGLPPSDGTILVPTELPVTARINYDWYDSLATALMNRVELRAQTWNIRSLELQLEAARSLTQPRLDLVAAYRVNGFGDDLLGYDDDDGVTTQGLDNMYETIAQGDHTGWDLGVEFNWPIGFRLAHTQVRNYEFRLLKARRVLEEAQIEVSHEMASAVQELDRAYAAATANLNRYEAASLNEEKVLIQFEAGTIRVDDYLRAQIRRADAEAAYFQSLVDYNKAIANLEFRKGTTLRYANVQLLEGPWVAPAYDNAEHRSTHRAYAWDAPWLHAEPEPMASPGPVGGINFMRLDPEDEEVAPLDAPQGLLPPGPGLLPFGDASDGADAGRATIDAFDISANPNPDAKPN
jgi:outer membrane protein TolC